ncbi:hypothetical protein Q6261_26300, partial [Klebsiella pneumoniae]|uniref:hypothetical protein n=1 Tax=Klebsiella pneumoniae TaxID=573 RepID=UPI0027317E77
HGKNKTKFFKRQYKKENPTTIAFASEDEDIDPYDKINDGGYSKHLAEMDLERREMYEPRERASLIEFIIPSKQKRTSKNVKKK